ncbi:MAG: Holliday junction resolvase RuvX [Planctomycetes bacterium]|nr:Holliday junction resolvase RuvX [Planctomycetota bacterium]
MRYLAIDVGEKRTGLAVGGDQTGIVTPLHVIETDSLNERIRQISLVVAEHGVNELVLGLPMNMDGTEGDAAKTVRGLKGFLEQRFGIPVHLMDERLTSHDADAKMSRSGLTRGQKKSRRDALAAAAILRDFLERKRGEKM